MENETFREVILSNLDPITAFHADDEYITTSDMILKVNLTENRIHIWSLLPQTEHSQFRETITEIQGNQKKQLQQIILQQYSLEN